MFRRRAASTKASGRMPASPVSITRKLPWLGQTGRRKPGSAANASRILSLLAASKWTPLLVYALMAIAIVVFPAGVSPRAALRILSLARRPMTVRR